VVEFRPFTPESARFLGEELARHHNLKLGRRELSFLLEILGGDASRLAMELEKLALFAGMVGLGAMNRACLRRGIGGNRAALRRLRLNVVTEIVLAVGVIVAVGYLGLTPPSVNE